MSETTVVRIDDKRRLRLTQAICDAEGIEPGSLVRITVERVDKPSQVAKNEKSRNPLMPQAPAPEPIFA